MPAIICRKCDGEGAVTHKGEQALLGVFTFGLAVAIDAALRDGTRDSIFARRCPTCRGRGFLTYE